MNQSIQRLLQTHHREKRNVKFSAKGVVGMRQSIFKAIDSRFFPNKSDTAFPFSRRIVSSEISPGIGTQAEEVNLAPLLTEAAP